MISSGPDARGLRPGVIAGEVRPPASKSISNRALIVAALAGSPSELRNLAPADDTVRLVAAFRALGIGIEEADAGLRIDPRRRAVGASIDAGGGGTTARFLLPLLCWFSGTHRLDGIPRLRERPMATLIDALRSLGGRIDCLDVEGHLPLTIDGGQLDGGRVELDGSVSSQFLSALLLIGGRLPGGLEISVPSLVSQSYVRLTEAVLADFGVAPKVTGDRWVCPRRVPPGRSYVVEADWSSATYPIAAAVIGGGPVRLTGLRRDSVQGDRAFLDQVEAMGARVRWLDDVLEVAAGDRLVGVEVDAGSCPDAVPSLAVVATVAEGKTVITGAANLRVKESDRIAALVAGVRAVGGVAAETADGLIIEGRPELVRGKGPVTVACHDDHRLAMAFSLLGLVREGVLVDHPGSVAKSWPGFWESMEAAWTPS